MTDIEKELEKDDVEKKKIAARIKFELAGSLSAENEDIINEWAFELGGI